MGLPRENGYHSVPTAGLAQGCPAADWLIVCERLDWAKREICPFVHLFIYPFIYLFIYLFIIFLIRERSVYLSLCALVHLSAGEGLRGLSRLTDPLPLTNPNSNSNSNSNPNSHSNPNSNRWSPTPAARDLRRTGDGSPPQNPGIIASERNERAELRLPRTERS
jgi:hypothetical protein